MVGPGLCALASGEKGLTQKPDGLGTRHEVKERRTPPIDV
jgi:hypothetical protein